MQDWSMSGIPMAHHGSTGSTSRLAAFIAGFVPVDLPEPVRARAQDACLDGTGAMLAALHPAVTTSVRIGRFAERVGGEGRASLIGRRRRSDPVSAALANGTLGYACDVEPFHPEAILHPIACILPAALAAAEHRGASGSALVAAVALGCEVAYRVSMAVGPVQQYDLGFHPSAVCGTFGATAAAAVLLGLGADATERALGLAACQASGLMAWETDPTENARPFQMGMAARNGVTAALLAADGFGGPRGVFDTGHTVYKAFSRSCRPELLVEGLGASWRGVTELAFKPYPCVAFLHPGLDAALAIRSREAIRAEDIAAIRFRFARSGLHCIDGNPLKSHCAQYVLAVALARGGLEIADLFIDRREDDAAVSRLSKIIAVVADTDALEAIFPARYAAVVEIDLKDERRFAERQDIARGYPDAPMSSEELRGKFRRIVAPAIGDAAAREALEAVSALWDSPDLARYAESLRANARDLAS
jgi:2-methylcitrate dehydratase PrpD